MWQKIFGYTTQKYQTPKAPKVAAGPKVTMKPFKPTSYKGYQWGRGTGK
jgi:hypothetical protein